MGAYCAIYINGGIDEITARKYIQWTINYSSQEEKDKIEKLITELEEANKTDDYADIKQRTESLKQAVMEIGDKVYGASNPSGSDNEDVIETDFSAEK